ncbi:MAG TPA: hypothetical protein DCL39_18470 [Alteromonas macleodii]|nr:hypothetical protein [Alteromonas macleodii]|tara:strand:- start:1274 stop:1612 length:339 start_codon:yes stop_codon:yes gene_type:complete
MTKITKTQLRQIIKEEINNTIEEGFFPDFGITKSIMSSLEGIDPRLRDLPSKQAKKIDQEARRIEAYPERYKEQIENFFGAGKKKVSYKDALGVAIEMAGLSGSKSTSYMSS